MKLHKPIVFLFLIAIGVLATVLLGRDSDASSAAQAGEVLFLTKRDTTELPAEIAVALTGASKVDSVDSLTSAVGPNSSVIVIDTSAWSDVPTASLSQWLQQGLALVAIDVPFGQLSSASAFGQFRREAQARFPNLPSKYADLPAVQVPSSPGYYSYVLAYDDADGVTYAAFGQKVEPRLFVYELRSLARLAFENR